MDGVIQLSGGPYSIVFDNYSKVDFALSRLDGNPFPASAAWVTRPAGQLDAADGSQTAAVSETDTIVETDFSVIWAGDGIRFGLRIHIPGQFIPPVGPTVGTAPYYYVGDDTDTGTGAPSFSQWNQMKPSDPYSWTNLPGLSVEATSTAGKSSLELTVTITDA
jgi:hypothetical protein